MRVEPDRAKEERLKQKTLQITRILAFAAAFVSVFVWFFKILFF